ncbi:MAG: MerR family transcriptional regulator [Bacteroidales bacterium]|jgi:DNA-binding transcriptional MerR regulator|nr:MerR family transcriptional regulator [Bacteroidales bacterium]
MNEALEKNYYSISETAKMFDVAPSLLRYWEKETELLHPYRNKKGTRFYTKNDIEILKTIYFLIKNKGYTIKGAKEAIKSNLIEENREATIAETLQKIKDLLISIKDKL